MRDNTMKRSILNMLSAGMMTSVLISSAVFANSGVHLEASNINVQNKTSLLRGAKNFANYCQGCHSLKFSRANRIAADTGVSDEQIKAIIFTRDDDDKPSKVGALMTSAIPHKDAANWFGSVPPDLSLVGRSRSADWIYTYMKSFYEDDSRPFGMNNTVFDSVGMPHVLLDLQGVQAPVYRYDVMHHGHNLEASFTSEAEANKALEVSRVFEVVKLGLFGDSLMSSHKDEKEAKAVVEANTKYNVLFNKKDVASFDSQAEADKYVQDNPKEGKYKVIPKSSYSVKSSHKIDKVIDHLELVKEGKQSPAEYDQTVRDLTNFLAYISEPAQLNRSTYGIFTLLFLGIFFIFAYFLKKEYWKDVH